MFADPQSITVNAIAKSLPRTSTGSNSAQYRMDTGELTWDISHVYSKRNRHVMRLTHRKVAADPLNAAQNLNYQTTISVTMDVPPVGYSPTELKQIWDGLIANLAASSAANTTKFIGGES